MNDKLKEIRKLHDEYEAILAEMRIKYADKNHKPIELLTNTTNLHRGELLKMLERVAELPEKWKSKDRYDHYDTSRESKTMTKCANELQAILEKDDEKTTQKRS